MKKLVSLCVLSIPLTAPFSASAVVENVVKEAQDNRNAQIERQAINNYLSRIKTSVSDAHRWLKENSYSELPVGGTSVKNSVSAENLSWGIRARYCEKTLMVYLEPQDLLGLGARGHGLIQAQSAREQEFLGNFDESNNVNVLGQTHSIPSCLLTDDWGPAPSSLTVVYVDQSVNDPKYDRVFDVNSSETRKDSCPAGQFGTGPLFTRTVTYKSDDPSNKTFGSWDEVSSGDCQAPYTRTRTNPVDCTYTNPVTGAVTPGKNVYKQTVTVNSNDPSTWVYGTPVFDWGTCGHNTTPPPLPDPTRTVVNTPETQNLGCPSGYTGSRSRNRIRTVTTVTFPWDQPPVVATDFSNWITSGSCVQSLACYQGERGSQDNDKYYVTKPNIGQRGYGLWRVSTSPCGSGSSNSGGGGGDNDNGRDNDGDGRTAQDGDTNDSQGPSNGDSQNSGGGWG